MDTVLDETGSADAPLDPTAASAVEPAMGGFTISEGDSCYMLDAVRRGRREAGPVRAAVSSMARACCNGAGALAPPRYV
jgi:hypothetical protein